MKVLSSRSAWGIEQVEEFLRTYLAPLRVATQDGSGYPMLCSLWFAYQDGRILCATKRDARVARALDRHPRCAFELAPNEPPYYGVRGRGTASISAEGAVELLGDLIDRYLGTRDSDLARWLLGNADDEVRLVISIDWITSWDYTSRMGGVG
jgi:hypothetical protein